jgi:predicted MFS family arabinose efflux permease
MSGVVCIVAGLAGLALFFRWELRAPSPLIDVRVFLRNRAFTYSNLAAFINYSATFAVTFLLSLYLQYVRGLNPQQAGVVLVAQPVMMAIGSPFAGRLSDRVEPRIVASAGMAVLVVPLLYFAVLAEDSPLFMIIAALAVLGIGFALFSSPNTNAVMGSVDKRSYGVAAGTLATMRMTGQAVSLAIAMTVLAVLVGNEQVTPSRYPEVLRSVDVTFGIFAVMCVLGVFASLARGKVR